MFEYAEFHDDERSRALTAAETAASNGSGNANSRNGKRGESSLLCPRCGRPVNDLHGICRQCGEVRVPPNSCTESGLLCTKNCSFMRVVPNV